MKRQEDLLEEVEQDHIVDPDFIKRLKETAPGEETLDALAEFYKVFGDLTRLRIIHLLFMAEEMCVQHIAETLEMSQSSISHQLRVLKQARLVKNRREGRTVYYSLADRHIQAIFDQGLEHILE